jgi:tetratricopeptide (TPR) repeat protein
MNLHIWKWKKSFGATLVSLVIALSSFSQSPADYIRMGDAEVERNNWPAAHGYYSQAFQLDSASFDALIKYAESLRNIKEYKTALFYYQEAFSKDEGKLFPEGLFWIASIEKLLGDYEAAHRDFRKYVKKNTKDKKSSMYRKSMMEIEACVWAMNYKAPKVAAPLVRLKTSEGRNAVENPNLVEGKVMILSTYNDGLSKWQLQVGELLDSSLINLTSLGIDTMQAGYSNVCKDSLGFYYFSKCGANGCHIYKTNKKELNCEDAELIRTIDEPSANSTMPYIAEINGDEYLFFASDRKGGQGGLDIWYSKSSNGVFINPENVGAIINTEDNEITPFYKDNQLYFSSAWHKGFGGFDIFSIKGIPNKWDIPMNIGKPWNSSLNDMYYKVQGDSLTILSSNRFDEKGEGACCNDVFISRKSNESKTEKSADFKDLAELNAVLPVTLYFHNDEPNPRTLDTTTTIAYSATYNKYLELEKSYELENTKGIANNDVEDAIYEVNDFFELKVKKGFSDLQTFSDLLIKELEKGNSVEVSVRGFASPRAKSDYNKNLSLRRISSLSNEILGCRDSLFAPYMNGTSSNGARLTFLALPFGEEKSATNVSDDIENTKQSIYSAGARLERKIEIQSITIEKDSTVDVLELSNDYHDFGKIGRFGIVHHDFIIENKGNNAMLIDSVIASCGCTEPTMSTMIIPPGGSATMDVGFNPFGGHGKEIKYVVIYSRGEKPRIITIEAEIEE